MREEKLTFPFRSTLILVPLISMEKVISVEKYKTKSKLVGDYQVSQKEVKL